MAHTVTLDSTGKLNCHAHRRDARVLKGISMGAVGDIEQVGSLKRDSARIGMTFVDVTGVTGGNFKTPTALTAAGPKTFLEMVRNKTL